MVQTTTGINVFSNMNTWIDFVIIPCNDKDFTKAEEIIEKAEDTYWTDEDAQCETMADWIGSKLEENNISFEIFFKNNEEEEEEE